MGIKNSVQDELIQQIRDYLITLKNQKSSLKGLTVKGRSKRMLILKTVYDVFGSGGYDACTIGKVAIEAGIEKGNITYYHPTKFDLVSSMLDETIGAFAENITCCIERANGDTHQALLNVSLFYVEYICKNHGFFIHLSSLLLKEEKLRDKVSNIYGRSQAITSYLIKVNEPSLSDEQVRILSLQISSYYNGLAVMNGLQLVSDKPLREVEDNAHAVILGMVKQAVVSNG